MATAVSSQPVPRLRRSDPAVPGIRRVRHGRGFRYLDEEGEKVTDATILQRVDELVIPPAWKDVWICPYPGGHIQATGVDERGRKQYLYHPRWRARQDALKFDDMVRFARSLPQMREAVDADLARGDFSREHVLACATRLLDRGFFRIGSEDYAVANQSYGLATMRKEHVTLRGEALRFDYPAKSGKQRVQAVVDPEVASAVATLKRRRGGGQELLAYKQSGRWRDVKSPDINEYVKAVTGLDVSAKDFRTWGATVIAAIALAVIDPSVTSKYARKRAIMRAVKEVAYHLGNTPAVARAAYIDPRVFDRYRDGETIRPALGDIADEPDVTAIQGPAEQAVLDLIA
ncbi:MAG: topoisomerase [Solirubrobacteraceae bacterium]|jgi:DNA topoisomerase IB|nr:topoisomerase [Solirubrobacteraceae bacterium]